MRQTGLLTDSDIRNAKPDSGKTVKRLLDGDRLYLFASVAANAIDINKTFVFRYEMDEKRHDYGIGPYPAMSLAEARRRAAELRLLILDGIDPMQERKDLRDERRAKKAAKLKATTFQQCWKAYFKIHAKTWKNPKHRAQWQSTMETYVLPVLGPLNVADIETGHVEKVLAPIWDKIPETASRVQNRIKLVLAYTITRSPVATAPALAAGVCASEAQLASAVPRWCYALVSWPFWSSQRCRATRRRALASAVAPPSGSHSQRRATSPSSRSAGAEPHIRNDRA
jgi:hypothetical protein